MNKFDSNKTIAQNFNDLVDKVNQQQKEIDIQYYIIILPMIASMIIILSRVLR